jgi:transposase, IS5 family
LQIFIGGTEMKSDGPIREQEQFLFPGLEGMLNPKHGLYKLANTYPWEKLEADLTKHYSGTGRPAKTIRRMSALLLLKQMYGLGDETIVEEWVQNPYYQYFSGETEFQWTFPCDPSDLVHFRKRIGEEGVKKIFQYSVEIHGKEAEETVVIADTTVQEKNITFPTDVKLYKRIIEYCWRIADEEDLTLRQRYSRKVKGWMILQRFRNHPKNYRKALKAERKLKTIAGRLARELVRKVPEERFTQYAGDLEVCFSILQQKKNDANKIYSVHEPDVYCVSKGKEHKKYEFGNKASFLKTQRSGIIVGALSIPENDYDGHTLEPALNQYRELFGKELREAIVDRGYKGKSQIGETVISMPKPYDKKHFSYGQLSRIRKKFRSRSAIEPVIGHLKSDCGLGRNYLKGRIGDTLNVFLAAAAFNLRKWVRKAKSLFASIFIELSETSFCTFEAVRIT